MSPSRICRRSLHLMLDGCHQKSFHNTISPRSAPTQANVPVAGLLKALYNVRGLFIDTAAYLELLQNVFLDFQFLHSPTLCVESNDTNILHITIVLKITLYSDNHGQIHWDNTAFYVSTQSFSHILDSFATPSPPFNVVWGKQIKNSVQD